MALVQAFHLPTSFVGSGRNLELIFDFLRSFCTQSSARSFVIYHSLSDLLILVCFSKLMLGFTLYVSYCPDNSMYERTRSSSIVTFLGFEHGGYVSYGGVKFVSIYKECGLYRLRFLVVGGVNLWVCVS